MMLAASGREAVVGESGGDGEAVGFDGGLVVPRHPVDCRKSRCVGYIVSGLNPEFDAQEVQICTFFAKTSLIATNSPSLRPRLANVY